MEVCRGVDVFVCTWEHKSCELYREIRSDTGNPPLAVSVSKELRSCSHVFVSSEEEQTLLQYIN